MFSDRTGRATGRHVAAAAEVSPSWRVAPESWSNATAASGECYAMVVSASKMRPGSGRCEFACAWTPVPRDKRDTERLELRKEESGRRCGRP